MPIFEFHCEMCNATVERLLEADEADIKAIQCETCQKNGKDNLAFKKISKTSFKVNGYNANNGYSNNRK